MSYGFFLSYVAVLIVTSILAFKLIETPARRVLRKLLT